jgi:chemotaxis protein MotB
MARRKKHEEHENHERWLVSYADFITLLFAFFTVLYATSQTDQAKLEAVIDSLHVAFTGGLPHAVFDSVATGPSTAGLTDSKVSLTTDTTTMIESIRRGLRGSLSDNVVQVGLINQSLQVVLPERIAFATGSADLHPSAYGPLSDVVEIIAPTPARIEVLGHADGLPVPPGSPFRDNWGLAAARAVAAVRYLESKGMPRDRLVVVADVTSEPDVQSRAITLRISLEQPALGGEIVEQLERKELIGPP